MPKCCVVFTFVTQDTRKKVKSGVKKNSTGIEGIHSPGLEEAWERHHCPSRGVTMLLPCSYEVCELAPGIDICPP